MFFIDLSLILGFEAIATSPLVSAASAPGLMLATGLDRSRGKESIQEKNMRISDFEATDFSELRRELISLYGESSPFLLGSNEKLSE